MSTKDIRFILPVYPLLCIYLSILINSRNYKFFAPINKKIIITITIFLSLLISNKGLFLKNHRSDFLKDWPHAEIMTMIKDKTPNLTTTLAILPDTKEINKFNLEAEAARQGEYVAVRQVISNKDTYEKDLEYFDWFLIKTGNQGVMSNEAKNLLSKLLLKNSSFIIHNEWDIPDKSKLILLRRKTLNSSLTKENCYSSLNNINIKEIKGGLNISFFGKGLSINSSSLLIDLHGKEYSNKLNLALANGFFHKTLEEDSCYKLSQDIPIDLQDGFKKNLSIKARLLNKNSKIKSLDMKNKNLTLQNHFKDDSVLMANRIAKVEDLVFFLRQGKFKSLFELVGIINQSDPKQTYLKDAEKIYSQRYMDNNQLKELYSILMTQILQRRILEAEKTISLILEKDKYNGNTYVAKALINLYLFDKEKSRFAINKAKQLEKSLETEEILNTIDGLTYLLEMKFINAYKTFT